MTEMRRSEENPILIPMSENTEKKNTIAHNHEILFVYDAKMCNPNGDPDNENKISWEYRNQGF